MATENIHGNNSSAEQNDQGLKEWEEVKRSHNLFKVNDYRNNNPDSPFKDEVDALYWMLRDDKLREMKECPEWFSKDEVEQLVNAGIFTQWELEDEGLVTKRSWKKLMETDRNLYPNLYDYMAEDPNLQIPEGTDVFFFGYPASGKTFLTMGVLGANGNGYTMNLANKYAAALTYYVKEGIPVGGTYSKFCTVISGIKTEKNGKVQKPFNWIEIGDMVTHQIANDMETSAFDKMSHIPTQVLNSKNRKIFYILIDAERDHVKVNCLEEIKDKNGDIIEERIRKKYISQRVMLQQFVSLFSLPENKDFMSMVDNIHFIVTKADRLGKREERIKKAQDFLTSNYQSIILAVKNYCHHTYRINRETDYNPKFITFSLGDFYLGTFEYDPTDSINLMETMPLKYTPSRMYRWKQWLSDLF